MTFSIITTKIKKRTRKKMKNQKKFLFDSVSALSATKMHIKMVKKSLVLLGHGTQLDKRGKFSLIPCNLMRLAYGCLWVFRLMVYIII